MSRRITVLAVLGVLAVASLMTLGTTLQQPRVAFIPQIVGIPYFDAMQSGGNAAAEDLNVEFIYRGPTDTNASEQLKIFNSLIQQGVEAISVSVLDPTSINPAMERAKAQGLHPFTSDSDAPDSAREAFVAQAFDKDLGFTIIDELIKRAGEDAKIGIISGEPTATNLNTWIDFMKQRVDEEYPEATIVDTRFAEGQAERAFELSTQLMNSHPDLDGLIAVASTTCPGVGQAIEDANKVGEVIGTGFCSPNTARSFIKSGAMPFTVLWNPEKLGYLTVWAGQQLANGEGFQKENDVPTFEEPVKYFPDRETLLLGPPMVFTEENVDDFNF